MEEPVDLQPCAEVDGTHVKLKEEEMEPTQKSDSVGNDRLASTDVATAAEKVINECLCSSDQVPLTIHNVTSEKPSGLERTDLNGHSHGNVELLCSEPLVSTSSFFTEEVEGSQNFQKSSSANHLLIEDKCSGTAEPHFSEQNSMITLRNSEEIKGNGASSSFTHHEGFQPSPVLSQTGDFQATQGGASNCLQFQPGTAEYRGAYAAPVSTHSKTLVLKSACVNAAFPCSDFPFSDHHDIQFKDDDKDLKDTEEEFDRSAANALCVDARKFALADREVRSGVSARTYSSGGALLHNLPDSIMKIVPTNREDEEGAVGGVAEFHDKLLKPHDSHNFLPRSEHALVTSDQPEPKISAEKLLVECTAEPGLEEYDCEIRTREQDQDHNLCPICKDKHVECALKPCAHFACRQCIRRMHSMSTSDTINCHMCRAEVMEIIPFTNDQC